MADLRILLLLSIFFLACLPSKADNITKVSVGLTIDSTVVMAESQTFGRRIDGVTIKPGLDYLLLKFRETTKSGKWLQFNGEIGAFSLKESRLLWTYPFNYSNIYMVDKELRTSERFPAHSLYWPLCMVGDRMCVYSPSSRKQDIWLTSLQGVPEIQMTIPIRGVGIAGGRLFLNNEDRLYYLLLK